MATNTYREGVSGASVPDTYLSSSRPTTNFGSSVLLEIGFFAAKGSDTLRTLMVFDVSDIPAGAVITSATLGLNASTAATSASVARAYRVVQDAWTEGGATWNTYDGSNAWTTAGCSDDGSDFTLTDGVDWNLPTSTGAFDITGMETLVQDAVDNRAGNLHLLLRRIFETSTTSIVTVDSGEHATPANRPLLTVNYTTGIPILGRRRRNMV